MRVKKEGRKEGERLKEKENENGTYTLLLGNYLHDWVCVRVSVVHAQRYAQEE